MWFDQFVWLTKQLNCQHVLIYMLLNPDCCAEVQKHLFPAESSPLKTSWKNTAKNKLKIKKNKEIEKNSRENTNTVQTFSENRSRLRKYIFSTFIPQFTNIQDYIVLY